jgi:hypothetical protein
MKKIAIGAAVIALGLILYFVCGSQDDGRDGSSSLLLDSTGAGTHAAGDRGESATGEEAGDGSVTADDDSSKKVTADTITFFLARERLQYTFPAMGSFRKMSATTEMTGYVANFASNSDMIRAGDQSKLSNVISILLPTDVSPGTYTEKSSNFMVQLFGQEAGTLYNLDHNCSFSLTVDEWGGPGGRVRGTFSGELKADGSSSIISINDGRFEAGIQ